MKKVLLILIPLILIGGGGAYFAATKGMINIPGITPKKAASNAQYQEPKDTKVDVPTQPIDEPEKQPIEEPEVPTEDPKLGQAKIASLWNEMDEANLEKLIADWKDEELAPILSAMSGEKVTKLLTRIAQSDPKRASRLTRAIQAEASKIEPPKPGEDL